jgi:hypothetical protein
MSEIAAQTGGRAFYNTNDLKAAMLQGVEHGANYYTLAYSPRNQKWNGAFRRITVKIDRPRVRLDYREGYYGTKDRMSQTSHRSSPPANGPVGEKIAIFTQVPLASPKHLNDPCRFFSNQAATCSPCLSGGNTG